MRLYYNRTLVISSFFSFKEANLLIFEGIEPTFQTYQVCTLTVKLKNL